MPTVANIDENLSVVSVDFDVDAMVVRLGTSQVVRTKLSARLANATPEQRRNWRMIGRTGIHWPDVDEDLSVAGIVRDTLPT